MECTVPYHSGWLVSLAAQGLNPCLARMVGEANFLKLDDHNPRYPPAVVGDCTYSRRPEVIASVRY